MRLLILLLFCGNCWAGDWFKTIEIKGGLGDEIFICAVPNCGKYDIGDGVIALFMVNQSIYSNDKWSLDFDYIHMSDIEQSFHEAPIDYYGISFKGKFNWY